MKVMQEIFRAIKKNWTTAFIYEWILPFKQKIFFDQGQQKESCEVIQHTEERKKKKETHFIHIIRK